MGKQINIKLYVLIILLALVAGLVLSADTNNQIASKPPMRQYLVNIPGYKIISNLDLGEEAFNMLKLDDHVFSNYQGKDSTPNLYIGYYYSTNKAYAAHSPLVCYRSQGWKVSSDHMRQTFEIPNYTINYDEIVTTFDEQKELVLYWYQARLFTNNQVYENKFDMGVNKLTHKYNEHAFVRIAVPFGDKNYKQVKQEALDFIRAFYPEFIKFVLT